MVDCEAVNIENDVAVVGRYPLAPNGLSAQHHQGSRNEATGHGNNLDRQRKGPKCFYQLAIIGDADEFIGGTGDDFLAS